MNRDVQAEIRELVDQHAVVLFMKGRKNMPQCGFSAAAINMLEDLGAAYIDVNVLQDLAVREGIKTFSDWPTIPQLYVHGKFIGGSDIMREMYESGELKTLLQK